ncbi:MAG: LacI family DNA-binding transcriptional regulator [Phycisphaerae bacterium]|jgi:DNA-binding LacI/PurR family transcriptional regulator
MIQKQRKNNIKDIAAICQVSTATVSRVLNKSGVVSEKNTDKVLKAIAENDYSPNQRSTPANIIGITVEFQDALSSPYVYNLLQAAEDEASNAGYDLLILRNERLRKNEKYLSVYLKSKLVSGIIILLSTMTDTFKQKLANDRFPHIILSDRPGGFSNFIDDDSYEGTLKAMEHLMKLGHRKIGIICPVSDIYYTANERLRAYQDALKKHNIDISPELIFDESHTNFNGVYDYGYRGINALLKNTAVTAVISDCSNGVVDGIMDSGLKIPENISVVSFEDSFDTTQSKSKLTTVAKDTKEMGKIAAKNLISQIENLKTRKIPSRIIIPTRFIVRESTSAVNQR